MQKIINPGQMLEYKRGNEKSPVPVFIEIEYTESEAEKKEAQGFAPYVKKHAGTGKLSIHGVVGPRSNGDAWGSCGQISDTIRESIAAGEFIPDSAHGWTVPDVLSFLDLWDQWHLNDMCPECEHQRAAGWPQMARQEIATYQWTLKSEIRSQQTKLKEEAIDRAASVGEGRSVGFSPLERKVLKLESFIKTPAETLADGLDRFYEPTQDAHGYFAHVENKTRGWITHSDDPRGLLGKPCEVCGYKYGSAWNTKKIPKEIMHTLEALTPSQVVPAWV